MRAINAKREDDWSRLGFALCWLVNAMPNFSKTRRPAIPMQRFNPFMRVAKKKNSDLARDAGFDALWNSCPEGPAS